jgi:lipoprotein
MFKRKFMRVYIIILILFFASCTRTIYVPNTTTETVVETLRDTVVEISPDSSLLIALLECDSAGNVLIDRINELQAGKRLLPPQIDIKDNILTATAKVDSLSIYLTLKDRYRESATSQTIIVNKLTKFQRTCVWGFWVLVVLIGIYMIFKIRKR